MSKSKTQLIISDKKIEREVARCDRIIKSKNMSEDSKATNYRLKALELEKVKNPSDEIKREIENCFKKAIKLNPDKKAFYLADLSNFYLFSNNNIEAATQNVVVIEETKQALIGIEKVYVNKTVSNLKKLNNAIKQIKSELEKGKITQEFANSLLDHLDVTKNHEHQLKTHDQLFKIVLARLSDIEKQLETINDQIEIIKDKLKKTGINDKAQLKDKIEGLEKYEYKGVIKPALNESLKDYANSFYWILANKILAYRVLDTGNIEGQVWENTAAKQFECASKKITKIGSTLCSYVPMYGSTASAVFDSIDMVSSVVLEVMELYTDAKNKRMVKLVNYELFLGRDKLEINPEELLNQGLLSGAIEIALGKSDLINKAITDPTSKEPIAGILNQVGNIKDTFIKKVIDPIMDTFFEVNVVRLNEVQKLAITDSALFITWLINQRSGKQEKEAFTKGINNPLEFGQKIAELYNEGGEIDQMLNAPAFIKNIKAYVEAIKECVSGIKETTKEAKELVRDIPEIADNIREYGKDEMVDKIKKRGQNSMLYRLKEKAKTKMDNYKSKKSHKQDTVNKAAKVDYDNDLHWYSDEEINTLLRTQINETQGRILAITQLENNDYLKTTLKDALQGIRNNGVPVLMPIHIDENHWVGAVIRKQQDGNIQVIYNDPKGNSIQDEKNIKLFIKIIQQYEPAANIIDLQIQQQENENDNDCRPFTVNNLVRLALVHNIDNFSKEQINTAVLPKNNTGSSIRKAHEELLHKIKEDKTTEDSGNSSNDLSLISEIENLPTPIEEEISPAGDLLNEESLL